MSRGLTDPVPVPEESKEQDTVEINQAIDELYISHNMLHDRLVKLERDIDHAEKTKTCKCKNCNCKQSQVEANAEIEAADRKFWKRGL